MATRIKPQPSDYICTVNSLMFYAEVKSSQNPVSFPFGNIEKGQLAYANAQVKAGGVYLFYLHNLITDEWYVVPASVIVDRYRDGKMSIKWSEITSYIDKEFSNVD